MASVPLRLLLVSLEYAHGTFSGNGVYATSLVAGLRGLGHSVHVVCGAPPGGAPLPPQPVDGVWALQLGSWGRLDRHSAWEQFGAAVARSTELQAWASAATPQLLLAVDFSASAAVDALRGALAAAAAAPSPPPPPPVCLFLFRVFARTDPAHLPLERAAAASATLVLALSEDDAAFARAQLLPAPSPPLSMDVASPAPPHSVSASHVPALAVVLPPLREDVRLLATEYALQLASAASGGPGGGGGGVRRTLLTSAVRLSPEKEPHRFVALVEALARSGALARHALTPCLCGVPRDGYGEALLDRLLRAAAAAGVAVELHPAFLGPAELGAVFARTVLNGARKSRRGERRKSDRVRRRSDGIF